MSASIEHAVLAAALDPIITIDAFGVIQSASDSVLRVFGWTPAELVGRNVNILMPEPHHAAHDGYLARHRRTGESSILGRPREFEAVRKNGDRFPIELCVSRVESGDGGMPLFVGIIRDISVHKRLEREAVLLKDLAVRIGGTSSINEARTEALALIGTATRWDYGEVWLPDGEHLAGAAQWMRPGSGLEAFARTMAGTRLPKGGGTAGRAWSTGRPVWRANLSHATEEDPSRIEAARSAGLRAAVAIPVVSDGVVAKVLLFFARTTRSDDLHMLELARAAAAPLEMLIQRKRTEQLLRESEARASVELGAMRNLHELVHRLLDHRDIPEALGEVLDAAISITGATMGNVQLLEPESGVLSIAAQRGFSKEFLNHFRSVRIDDQSACGRALRSRERVIIEDVQQDPSFRPHRRVAADAGFRAVQSTPLVASNGHMLGMLSTHYAAAHRPSDRDLRILDLYARQAADFIERIRAQKQLDEHRHSLEQRVEERTRQLELSQEQLRMADRLASIGTLAAGLGHDMNNVLLPVRARLNALVALGDAGDLPSDGRKHVEEIQKSVAYLQQLADGLHFLTLDPDTEVDARGGGGATDLTYWWSQAGALLSKAVPKHVRVSSSFPSDLPQAAIASHGLTQAVLNLVVNAGESIPPTNERKRKRASVRISGALIRDADSRWIRLSVADNGTGMTDEVKRRAFEMFFTTKPRGLGTGLGLALVRKVTEAAGGRVEIESELGKGTTVTMVVPAVGPQPDGAENDKPCAVVSVGNGRAAGLIRHLLAKSGTPVHAENDRARARIWVLDPTATSLDAAKTWRRGKPEGRLVLFGRPDPVSAPSWSSLNPVTIEAPDDFESVRKAINLALSHG